MFLLTLLFFYLHKNKKTIKTTKTILDISEKYNGLDQRNTDTHFEKNRITKDREKLLEFVINYNKKQMLIFLENKNISNHRKIDEINKYDLCYNIIPIDITKGNLFKDYDFEI